MHEPIGWGILGTGAIARKFCDAVRTSRLGRIAAVGTRNASGKDLGAFAPARIHAGYDALLTDDAVDAVYIALPHTEHVEWGIRAARAGKHVLCEKPVAVNAGDALRLIEAAQANGVFFMEAYMYRLHPQTARLVELVQSGIIGEIRLIQARNGFAATQPPTHRLFAHHLAGGAVLDVGGYPMSMARLLAGAATGKPFAEPLSLAAAGHIGATRVDGWTSALLRFEGDVLAELTASIAVPIERNVKVFGSHGSIVVESPWFGGGLGGGTSTIVIDRGGQRETIEIDEPRMIYAIEADVFAGCVLAGKAEPPPPAMAATESLANMRALDAWRAQIGAIYDFERAAR